jgi:bacterioferritin-associated ferredoxin
MIVCLCRGISERTIRSAIAAGASSPEAIAEACGAGDDCRACCEQLIDLIEEALGAPA